jgi:hypothetical protein
MCSLAKEHLLTRQVPFSNSQVPVKCPEYPVLRGFYGWEEVLSRLNPAEPVDNWRVMSPTSYQAAPPRAIDTMRLAAVLQILRCPLSVQFGDGAII